jgi:hypothetical protein
MMQLNYFLMKGVIKMASTIQPYQISNQLREAENYGFSFANNEKKYKRTRNNRQKIIDERLEGRISPFWIIMSIIGVAAGVGLGIYAAYNAEIAIASTIDPDGNGIIPPFVIRIIGISISVIGMLIGHEIYDSITANKRDPITGNSTKTGRVVVFILAALFYILFQVALVHTASSGAEEYFHGVQYLPYLVLGVAIFELLVGAFVLNKAFSYTFILVATILLWWFTQRMNRNARLSTDSYRLYSSLLDTYNHNNPHPIEREGNDNIRRAIEYYTGIQNQHNDDLPDTDDPEESPVAVSNAHPNPTTPKNGNGSSANSVSTNNQQRDLESFIDDNIDDDLTM